MKYATMNTDDTDNATDANEERFLTNRSIAHAITSAKQTGTSTTSEYFVARAMPKTAPSISDARKVPFVRNDFSAITNRSSASADAMSFWTTIKLPVMFGSVASRNVAISAGTGPNNSRVNHQTATNSKSGITSTGNLPHHGICSNCGAFVSKNASSIFTIPSSGSSGVVACVQPRDSKGKSGRRCHSPIPLKSFMSGGCS